MPSSLALAVFLAAAPAAPARPPAPVSQAKLITTELETDESVVLALAAYYTKHEHEIPMRDGVRLHTAVWTPKPQTADDTRRWPFLLLRTPYAVEPYGSENRPDAKDRRRLNAFAPSRELLASGYIFVHQDVRGRMMSEGTFVDIRPLGDPNKRRARDPGTIDESTDAWDTIDWLVKNVPRNNGRAGVWGISYPGFYAAQAAVDAHPALQAVVPMAPVTDWFLGDDFHHNGAFFLADAFSFYVNFGKAREKPVRKWAWDFEPEVADVYDFFLRMGPLANADRKYLKGKIAFWNEILAHPNRDAWWEARDPRPQYREIRPAVLVVGGWYDCEDLWGSLETYQSMNRQTPKNRVSLVMGPWKHGGWHRTDGDRLGDIDFGQKTSARYQSEIETSFFESHLKGDGLAATPEAFIFVTGANEWRKFDVWPPPEAPARPLHLAARGALVQTKPAGEGADSFVADPSKPVPYRDGASKGTDFTYMTADQRFAARRPDVLHYETATLTSEVTIAGPVEAQVWFATTGTDADVVVKLIDIWPEDTVNPDPNPRGIRLGGYQQLVRAEVMRGRFRKSFAVPAPFVPGQPELVRFTLPDLAHSFRAGHRIAVQIQSSWFPLVDRNPQQMIDIASATEDDFKTHTHRVERSAARPSAVFLPVLSGTLP